MLEWLGGAVAAWMLADFVAGVIHWAEDRYARPDWPVLGPLVAQPNLLHHSDPQAFLAGGYWWRNSTTLAPAALAMIAAWLCGAPWWLQLSLLFTSQANEIHAWSHRKGRLPRLVELCQESGILQSAKHHGLHHKSPHEVRYCVLSNWLNPWLDAFDFWGRVERGLEFVFNITPRGQK